MSILSALVLAVDPVRVQATQIGDVAATLSPGEWGQLSNPPANFFRDPFAKSTCQSTNLAFAGKGVWNPSLQRVYILGAGHICDSKLHVYDDATNSWLEGGRIGGKRGHAYNHNTYNSATGKLGFIDAGAGGGTSYHVYEFSMPSSVSLSNPWVRLDDVANDGEITAAYEYWPAEGKYFLADGTFGQAKGVSVSGTSTTLSVLETKQSCFSDGQASLNHPFAILLKDGRMAYGGGNTSAATPYFSRRWCTKVAGQPSVQMPNMPSGGPSLRIPEANNPTEGSILAVDPISGDILVYGNSGATWKFSISGNSWSNITSSSKPPPLRQSTVAVADTFAVGIPGHNVVMVCKAFSQTNSSCWIHKPNGAPGVVDTEDPTVPTGVAATAISDTQVQVSFSPSTDNVGIGSYRVERDGGVATITGGSSPITVGGLSASTLYSFKVKAIDTSGNESAYSSPAVTATTLAGATPPAVTAPAPSSTLTSSGMNLAWQGNGTTVTDYWIHVGSAQGGFDYADSGSLGSGTLTYAVGGLPIDGSTIWVRLWYQTTAGWVEVDYSYTAFTGAPDLTAPTVPSSLGAVAASSSSIALSFGASSDNVEVREYKVYRGGVEVGVTTTNSYVDTGLAASSSYNYRVSAVDTSNNESALSNEASATTLQASAILPNTLVVTNTSGSTMTNRPLSVGRMFRKGEFPACTAAAIGVTNVTTQTNVKTRWSDGTIKTAIVSFLVPSLTTAQSATVTLTPSTTCNDNSGLTASQMLDSSYNFDAQMTLVGGNTQTRNARTMLSAGKWRYWLQGSVVTAVIIEDRTTARADDIGFDGCSGDQCPLHPIFEAWFYPTANKVDIGYTVENVWSSSDSNKSAEDNTYSLTLHSGNTSPAVEFTHASFTHIGLTRWHKRFVIGAELPALHIDHNKNYLVQTGVIPHYGTDVTVGSSAKSGVTGVYQPNSSTFNKGGSGDSNLLGNYRPAGINNGGFSQWKHYLKTWEAMWLQSQDQDLYDTVIGNADLIGRAPIYIREADTLAGTGDYFDQSWNHNSNLSTQGSKNGTGSVETFGRPVSINARPTVYYSDGPALAAQSGDDVDYGSISTDGWPTGSSNDSSHFSDGCSLAYLLTGRYYYMECVQLEAAYRVAWKIATWGGNYQRPGDRFAAVNTNMRIDAWQIKSIAMGAVVSPDGTPEQAYFGSKVKDAVAHQEGIYNLTLTYPDRQALWGHGRVHRSSNCSGFVGGDCIMGSFGPSPFGMQHVGGTAFIDEAYVDSGVIDGATASWEANQIIMNFGMVQQQELASTDTLLSFYLQMHFEIVKNPACHSPAANASYAHMEAFRWPSIYSATGAWVATCEEFANSFQTDPSARGGAAGTSSTYFGYRDNGVNPQVMDDSKLGQAVAALSFGTHLTINGHNGQEVYDAFIAQAPNHYDSGTGRFGTEGTRWAITPFTGGGTVVIPPEPPEIFPLQLFDRPLLPLNPLGGL